MPFSQQQQEQQQQQRVHKAKLTLGVACDAGLPFVQSKVKATHNTQSGNSEKW